MREEMRGLAQSIVASHEARVTGLASIRRDVSAQLQELESTRRDASRTLHGHLARGRADLRASVSAQLQELAKAHADLRASVSAQLQELDRAHNAMAQRQREGLTKVHADLDGAETRRKAGVHSWMEEVAAGHRAAREEWQNLAATMQAKRAGVMVAEAPAKVAPAVPMVEAPEEEEETVEVGEVTEEFTTLAGRVFEYLANHPDGRRLTELQQEFGLGRFQAARVVKNLINEGKARKQNLLYFAT